MIKYLIAGALAIVLLGGAIFLSQSSKRAPQKNTEQSDSLTSADTFGHAHGIAVDAADAKKVYIATHEGLYLLENDTRLSRVGTTADDLMGFSAHPTEAGTFFSSGHPAHGGNIGLQKTTDGGITWTKVSDGLDGPADFHAMTVSAANPDVIYGFFSGKLQRSNDGGATWEYAKGAVNPISLASHPANPETVYAATEHGMLISEDGGDTWKSISSQLDGGMVTVFALDPGNPQYMLAFSEALGGLGKSTDGGATWERISEGFGGELVLYLAFSKTEPDIVYALTRENHLYKSTNMGGTWSPIR